MIDWDYWVAIVLILSVCLLFFYNPLELSREFIAIAILLTVINWNITKLKRGGEND